MVVVEAQPVLLHRRLVYDRLGGFGSSNLADEQAGSSADAAAFYYDVQLPLTHFIEPEFLSQYIRNAATSVVAISAGTRIDQDDVFALDATGRLILHLTKDTYERLGLDGQPSHFSKRHPQKHVVTLDLTIAAMTPGKKLYDRIRWCLENAFKQPIRFFMARSYQGNYVEMVFPPSIRATKRTLSRDAGLCRDLKIPDMNALRPASPAQHADNAAEEKASAPIFTLNSRKRRR
ncbi:ribonuclease P 40kDa subunit-domain-containing protein, partial [Syncephalis pseudoplumigaleata]